MGEGGILLGAFIIVLVVAVDVVDDLLERRAARPVLPKKARFARPRLAHLRPAPAA
jgi:hypothetical protein